VSRVVDEVTGCLEFTELNELIVSLYYGWYCFWCGGSWEIDIGGLTCTGHNSELLNILFFWSLVSINKAYLIKSR